MYLKVSVLLCFFSLTATANINSSQSFSIETDKFKSGTQSASAGTAISLGGDNFTFTLPQMTASEAEKKVTSPIFTCPSGYTRNNFACSKIATAKKNVSCTKPTIPAGSAMNSPQCNTTWDQYACRYYAQCGSNGNSAGGGGNSGSMVLYGVKSKSCPSGFYSISSNYCEFYSVKSASVSCRSGYQLGYGGYVCFK